MSEVIYIIIEIRFCLYKEGYLTIGHRVRVWQEQNCQEIDWEKEIKEATYIRTLMDHKCLSLLELNMICQNHSL